LKAELASKIDATNNVAVSKGIIGAMMQYLRLCLGGVILDESEVRKSLEYEIKQHKFLDP
jgi:hypothetical protein